VAIKKVHAGQGEKEVEAHGLLDHPNVVKFREYISEEKNGWIVMEYISGVNLFELLASNNFKPLNDLRVKSLFLQLVKALQHCHSKGVFHRDIKLENILVTSKGQRVKLIDFGLAGVDKLGSPLFTESVGSLDYAAPEVFLDKSYDASAADVFSLGVVLFCMVAGLLPFRNYERETFMDSLDIDDHPQLDLTDLNLAPQLEDLLKKMLAIDPQKRITLEEIENHPWLNEEEEGKE